MGLFKKNLQNFFIYFFPIVSVVIVVLGVDRIKNTEPVSKGNGEQSPSDSVDTSGIVIIDPSRKSVATARDTKESTFTGKTYQTPWGKLATTIRVKGGKVVAVAIPTLPDSPPSINAEAYLIAQALKTGSANIQGVSGATYTSLAFKSSLESAIAQANNVANTQDQTTVVVIPNTTGNVSNAATPTSAPLVQRTYRHDNNEEWDD